MRGGRCPLVLSVEDEHAAWPKGQVEMDGVARPELRWEACLVSGCCAAHTQALDAKMQRSGDGVGDGDGGFCLGTLAVVETPRRRLL